jgi:nucleoside-diphosphate-sugar epimerase/putative sterol carrier protein
MASMPQPRTILLTGATGLVGRYLLRDLLSGGYSVAVLARDSRAGAPARDRIAEIIDFWSADLGRHLPMPQVFACELGSATVSLTAADQRWLKERCKAVIHSAASLSFRESRDGEPWRTNVEGTASLLNLSRSVGISEWHQVSTAFVCGTRTGPIFEEYLDGDTRFHNPYEESKHRSERLIRQAREIQATIYRPAIIIGDSQTGYMCSFNGFYRFLEVGVRLAAMRQGNSPFRLPFTGDEHWDLVPVDWVSRAIVSLLAKPHWHGRIFHLVSRAPTSTRFIYDVGVDVLDLPRVELAGTSKGGDRLRELFLDSIRDYWPYLGGSPRFDCANTLMALGDLPAPCIDRAMLERLIRFAVAGNWGRVPRLKDNPSTSTAWSCAHYIEHVFPAQAAQSRLGREAGLDLAIGIDVHGAAGGQWTCKWREGEFLYARQGRGPDVTLTYHTDARTFRDIVTGKLSPPEAFFAERVRISGNIEAALKLMVLFGQFLVENTAAKSEGTEVLDSSAA